MINVFEKIKYQFAQFELLIKEKDLLGALKEALYFNREMVLVEKYLETPLPNLKKIFPMNLILIKGSVLNSEQYEFSNKVRKMKSKVYLKNGFNAFWGIYKNKIIAEQWWTDFTKDKNTHPDLKWMKINLKPGEIYAFDLFIDPEYRGSQATNFFIWNYLTELKKLNYQKIYGSFFTDNLPSLWIHRIFSYNEFKKVKRHRFFFFEIKDGKLCFS